jgi:hypothetical protein
MSLTHGHVGFARRLFSGTTDVDSDPKYTWGALPLLTDVDHGPNVALDGAGFALFAIWVCRVADDAG